jgi:DNA adenine methylase
MHPKKSDPAKTYLSKHPMTHHLGSVQNCESRNVQEARVVRLCEKNERRDFVSPILPVLKWPGGKRWFVAKHSTLLPSTFGKYFEPFLGSGAVFFSLNPPASILGDLNEDLISLYQGIKDDWAKVGQLLNEHQRKHGTEHYYRTRSTRARSAAGRAARILYLNRTCFNGIYRVNLKGIFNVPKGTRNTVVLKSDDFAGVARLLRRAELRVSDFEPLIDEAKENDFVFADSPYTIQHNLNAFIKYNEKLFSWSDQIRLAKCLLRAKSRGVKIVATNANHQSIRELYEAEGFELLTLSRFSSASANPECRGAFDELVIRANCGKG